MKHVDEYRSRDACDHLVNQIQSRSTDTWTIMEVCGGQTHGLLRHGIDQALAGSVRLVHGPGCPVCVTPADDLDLAVELCQQPGVTVVTFGDMLRVPGSSASLQQARACGGDVEFVYSPIDVIRLAEQRPDQQLVFLAVGFETTTPATALALLQAERRGVKNLTFLTSHVRVLPAMELLMQGDGPRIDGFLAAGHVCTVTGFHEYHDFARRHRTPVVVTGFEPLDLLAGLWECVHRLETNNFAVVNRYGRSVREEGNEHAIGLIDRVFEPFDMPWRGLGVVPGGGLRLRRRWTDFDARCRFHSTADSAPSVCACRSGEVLAGRIKPPECEQFGVGCTPETPLGAPMVSAEGACAAYYQFADRSTSSSTGGDNYV